MTNNLPVDLNLPGFCRWSREADRYTRMEGMVPALLDEMRVYLAESAFAYEVLPVDDVNAKGVLLSNRAMVRVRSEALSEARSLAVAICTIGPGLEQAVSGYFKKEEALRGLMLDSLSNAALDGVVREAWRAVERQAGLNGDRTGAPIYPGNDRFPLAEQPTLFSLVDAGKIGVRLICSGMMSPQKSVSFIMGIGPRVPAWTPGAACDSCNLTNTCKYRLD